MEQDIFTLLLSGWIFFIFGATCIMSIIFTFSLTTYLKIEEKLSLYIFSEPILTPWDRDIEWFDAWLRQHNRIAGMFMILLSLVDLNLSFQVINML